MQYSKIRRGLIVLEAIALILVLAFLAQIQLTNYCSSGEKIDKKTTIERSETTKSGKYNPYRGSHSARNPLYPFSYQENSTERTSKTREEPTNWRNDYWCGVKFTDVTLAIFTFILAIFTGCLWFSTEKLWSATTKSVEIAERALTDLERPWIFMESMNVQRREPIPVPNCWFISFVFRNIGRAPAIIEDCMIKIEDIDTLPSLPDYKNSFPLDCIRTVAQNIDFETGRIGPAQVNRAEGSKIVRFVVFGRLTYKELNGKTHHTGFAVEVSPHLPAASAYSNNNYTYYD